MPEFRRWLACSQAGNNQRGQDLIEYAMIAGFLAVVSGVFLPNVTQDISAVFSKVASVMTSATSTS